MIPKILLSYRFSKYKSYFFQLYKLLGFKPRDIFLYKLAFSHSSLCLTNSAGKPLNNERLEYVGDAILDAVVADLMYCKFPDADEGRLTLMRSNLVNRKSLDKLSNVLGITDFIIAKTNESSHQHLAGNAFEALIGAIYYDRGYKYCRKFIDRIIIQNYNWEEIGLIEEDYKSIIFQFAQKMKWIVMFDTFEAIEANEKQFHFNAQLLLNNEFVAEGKGWSKKDAEQEASRRAYEKLSKTIALVK